jgi:hypothetical protein
VAAPRSSNSTISTNGLGSFMFKVTDARAFPMTNTVGVHIQIRCKSRTIRAGAGGGAGYQAVNVGVNCG